MRYALVFVTEDGCHAVLRRVLLQAHEFLHARLLELAAEHGTARHDDAWGGNDPAGVEQEWDGGPIGAGAEESPVDVLRLMLHSWPLSQVHSSCC